MVKIAKTTNDNLYFEEFEDLIQEANKLKMIFNSIVNKKTNN